MNRYERRYEIGDLVLIGKQLHGFYSEQEDEEKMDAAFGEIGTVLGSTLNDFDRHSDETDVYEVEVNGVIVWPAWDEMTLVGQKEISDGEEIKASGEAPAFRR